MGRKVLSLPKSSKANRRKNDIILPLPAQPTMSTETLKQASGSTEAAPQQSLHEMAQSMVPFTVLSPFASCLVTPDQLDLAIAANYNEIYIYHNGQFFLHMQLRGNRHIRVKIDGLPSRYKDLEKHLKEMLPSVEESMNFLPAGKIPGAYWDQIVEFFRQVMRAKKSDMEAHAWILWNEQQGYHIHIPKQIVSKASVQYDFDVPSESIIVVDVHSHNTMSAFYSGTDNSDDKEKVYYTGVVGKITDNSYEWVMRFNLKEKKIQTTLDDIFDLTTEVNIPAEWLEQVEVRTYGGKSSGKPVTSGYAEWLAKKENQGNVNGTAGSPGSSPQNPAKWTAMPTAQNNPQEKGDGKSKDNFRNGPNGHLFDDDEHSAFGFSDITWPDHRPVEGADNGQDFAHDKERNVFVKDPKKRAELEELLNGIPEVSTAGMEEHERKVTEWLARHGYDKDGNDMLTLANNEVKEMKGQTVDNSEGSEEEAKDPVGKNQFSGMAAEVQATHGNDAANAYELIDAMITELEEADDALLDIATQCYHLMTDAGRYKIQSNGLGS